MERKPRDPKLQQDNELLPEDYRMQGLRVLARLIARLHLEKASGKKGDGDTHETRKR